MASTKYDHPFPSILCLIFLGTATVFRLLLLTIVGELFCRRVGSETTENCAPDRLPVLTTISRFKLIASEPPCTNRTYASPQSSGEQSVLGYVEVATYSAVIVSAIRSRWTLLALCATLVRILPATLRDLLSAILTLIFGA